jgi:hypothetical protein
METKYTASEECISAEDARFMAEALNEYIINQTKRGAYEGDIRSARIAKDAINRVLDHASFQHDDICFIVKIGTRNIP